MTFVEERAKNESPITVRFQVPRLVTSRFTFLVFLTSITVLFPMFGCTSVQPGPTEPEVTNPEPNEVEIAKPEPNEVLIPEPEPNDAQPPKTEPNVVETTKIEPNTVDANEIKPDPNVSFHNKSASILTNFVDDEGMVKYKALKRKRSELGKLLDEFAKLEPNEYKSWSKEDRIAFWINAYNIQRLRIIVDNYPIKSSRWRRILGWPASSIRYIDKNIDGIDKQKFIVMNEEFTLRRIEQRFFCKEFDEPRVFFTLTRATLSGPPLRKEPYCGHKLDKQLDNQAKKFLSSSRAFRIDRKKRKVYLSLILKPTWHGKEFIGKYGTDKKFKEQSHATRAVLNCVSKYISRKDRNFLERKNYSVKYVTYDWKINESSAKK